MEVASSIYLPPCITSVSHYRYKAPIVLYCVYIRCLSQVHAGSAKAAIDAMTRHLAVEWGPNNIRVNCIAPGPIEGTVGMKKLGEYIVHQFIASYWVSTLLAWYYTSNLKS